MEYKMIIERDSFIPQARTCDLTNTIYATSYETALYKFNKKLAIMKKNFENKGLQVELKTISETRAEMIVNSVKMNETLYELYITLE